MKFTAVTLREIREGELFSHLGPDYFSLLPYRNPFDTGAAVRVRLAGAVPPDDAGTPVWRITLDSKPDATADLLAAAEQVLVTLGQFTGRRWCWFCGLPTDATDSPAPHTSDCIMPKLEAAVAKAKVGG